MVKIVAREFGQPTADKTNSAILKAMASLHSNFVRRVMHRVNAVQCQLLRFGRRPAGEACSDRAALAARLLEFERLCDVLGDNRIFD